MRDKDDRQELHLREGSSAKKAWRNCRISRRDKVAEAQKGLKELQDFAGSS